MTWFHFDIVDHDVNGVVLAGGNDLEAKIKAIIRK
jgi:hypothetical protein